MLEECLAFVTAPPLKIDLILPTVIRVQIQC